MIWQAEEHVSHKKKLIPSNYTGWFIGTPITGYNSHNMSQLNKAAQLPCTITKSATSHPFERPVEIDSDLRQSHQSEKSSWCGVGFLFLNAFTLLLISFHPLEIVGASKEIDSKPIPWTHGTVPVCFNSKFTNMNGWCFMEKCREIYHTRIVGERS